MNEKDKIEPSLVETETTTDPIGPRHLTESQGKALHELSNLYSLAGHTETYGGFIPRAKPLIIGPSGCGKTALVRRLCDSEKLPLLIINSGSWVVYGARSEPHTLSIIHAFVRKNKRGCIFMDEVDKCVPAGTGALDQSWNLSVLTEILALLDCERLGTSDWLRSDMYRLSRNFFIVGAGAWQWKSKRENNASGTHAQAVIADFEIPEEIAFRFNARLLVIEPPNRKDFANAIRRVNSDIGLRELKENVLQEMVDSAIASRVGMRWVEQYVSELLSIHPQLRRNPEPAPAPAKTEKTVVSATYFNAEKDNFYRLLEAAEPSLSHLQAHVSIIKRPLWTALAQKAKPEPVLDIGQENNDATTEMLTPEKLDLCLNDLLDGLHHRYSINTIDSKIREEKLWLSGQRVLGFCKVMLKEKAAFLASQQSLTIVLNATVRLSRVMSAMRYLGTLELASDD